MVILDPIRCCSVPAIHNEEVAEEVNEDEKQKTSTIMFKTTKHFDAQGC